MVGEVSPDKAIRWQKHGDLWMMTCGEWKRAIIFMEPKLGYQAVGFFGLGRPLFEIAGMNRRECEEIAGLEIEETA